MKSKDIEVLYYKNTIIEKINEQLDKHQWSLKRLSDEADIAYDTLKKLMCGKISSPTIYTIVKISEALNCSLDYLLGRENSIGINSSNISPRTYTLISTMADFEAELTRLNNENDDIYYVPLYVPTGRMGDEMLYESVYYDYINVASYRDIFGDNIACGIKITNKSLHPTFLENDILLIAQDRHPIYGETGIFLRNHHLYIRKYLYGTPSILKPVNGIGKDIVANDLSEWFVFGRVLSIIRK